MKSRRKQGDHDLADGELASRSEREEITAVATRLTLQSPPRIGVGTMTAALAALAMALLGHFVV